LEGIREAVAMRGQRPCRLVCCNGEIFHLLKVRPKFRALLDGLPAMDPPVRLTFLSSGQLLDQWFDWVLERSDGFSISLDSLDEDLHQRLRGISSLRIQRAMRTLVRKAGTRGNPKVSINAILMRSNIREMDAFVAFAAEIGVRILQWSPLRPGRDTAFYEAEHIPTDSDEYQLVQANLARLKPFALANGVRIYGFRFEPSTGPEAHCPTRTDIFCDNPWEKAFIHRDGKVTVCCGLNQSIGNLLEHPFSECWNSEKAVAIRHDLFEHKYKWCKWNLCQNAALFAKPKGA